MQLLMISDSPLSSSTSSLTNAIYHVKECKLPYKKFWCIMLLSLYKNLVLFVNRLKQIDNADTRMSSCPQKLYWTCEFRKNRSFFRLSLEWRKKKNCTLIEAYRFTKYSTSGGICAITYPLLPFLTLTWKAALQKQTELLFLRPVRP